MQKDKEVALAAVQQDGEALQNARYFQDDREVVRAAVQNSEFALKHASEKLKNDEELKLIAVETASRRPRRTL